MSDASPSALDRGSQAADADFGSHPVDQPVLPCQRKTWVDIRLVDRDGKPMAGQSYRLELPDGRVIEGTLDDQGQAGVEGIDPGDCKLTFPDLPNASTRLR